MKANGGPDDRINDLKQKIQDPGYLNMAITEMALRLAKDLFPRIYSGQAPQGYPDLSELPKDSSSFH
ncbi:MAG: hypothetical protein GW949_10145 [Spirochaetales bacterium]|nr:hypothetical protein [Spirochaetales bacterium]